MPEGKAARRGLRPLEIIVIVGILLAFVVPVLERGRGPEGRPAAETQAFQEDEQAAQEEAARVDTRQHIANYIKVGGFIFMAILAPTLLIREWLRQGRSRGG